ncbi:MAG: DUF1489 family protein [Solirubrobacterales bacterium]
MIHLIKLAVGCDGVDALKAFQAVRLAAFGHVFHLTRAVPKRADALTEGGSIYWVIKGSIAARQRVLDVQTDQDEEGRPRCRLILDAEVIDVEPRAMKPFQGWRYLSPDAAPRDRRSGEHEPPPEMAAELRALGLI